MLDRYMDSSDTMALWSSSSIKCCIELPDGTMISPRDLRRQFVGQPCQCCNIEMVGYTVETTTDRRLEAEKKGWFVFDHEGKKRFTKMSSDRFCHPRCITLDHKLPKSKYPNLMFKFENLQIWCAGCNTSKQNSMTYEIEISRSKLNSKVARAIEAISNL